MHVLMVMLAVGCGSKEEAGDGEITSAADGPAPTGHLGGLKRLLRRRPQSDSQVSSARGVYRQAAVLERK